MAKTAPTVRNPADIYQRENRDIVKGISDNALLQGRLLKDVKLSTTTTRVPHGLSRPYTGFLVVDKTATGDVWRDAAVAASPDVSIPLVASSTMTVTLWVF